MRRALGLGLTVLLLAAICAVEGTAKKKPAPPPDPRLLAIQNISVLPVVDARAGEKDSVNMAKLQSSVVKILTKKHYPVSAASTSGDAGQIVVEDLEGGQSSYLKKLGPASERWVMVVLLDDIHSKFTFGSTGNAEMDGYLFDKDSGELLWKGKGVGQAGQGGLIGMSMKGMMKSAALDAAVGSLLGSMPNRPKPGK